MLSDRFRAAVEQRNLDHVPELFHERAVFRSPVLFKPYEGRDQVLKVLRAAEQVLGIGGSFRYLHQLEDPDDRVAILEFATEVDGKQVEGIDKLTFDEDGLITELKVMIRPASDGTGVIAGGAMRAVLESAGIHNVLAKSLGSSNAHNVIKATINGLTLLRDAHTVTNQRGVSMNKVFNG